MKNERLDHLLRQIEHVEPAEPYRAPLPLNEGGRAAYPSAHAVASRRAPRRIRAAAMIAALLALSMLAGLLPAMLWTERPPVSADEPTPPADDAPGDVTEEYSPAPWLNGTLHLTTLTYSEIGDAPRLTKSSAFTPLSADTTVDPARISNENLTLALRADTKMAACGGTELLQLTEPEGAHKDCDAVYYRIRENEVFCLDCYLDALLSQHELYADVMIRLLLEDGIFSYKSELEREVSEREAQYAALYRTLHQAGIGQRLAAGEKLQAEQLGILQQLDVLQAQRLRRELADGVPSPALTILEYGKSARYCLFALSSRRTDRCYGTYLCDISTGTVTRLEGNIVGVAASSLYELSDGADVISPPTQFAEQLEISEDYSTVYAIVPSTAGYGIRTLNDRVYPEFDGCELVVLNIESGARRVVDENGELLFVQKGRMCIDGGNLIVALDTGTQSFCVMPGNAGSSAFTVRGKFRRLIETQSDTLVLSYYYKNKTYSYHRLRDGADVTADVASGTLLLPVDAYYDADGRERVHTVTGEREWLWRDAPTASVYSRDERFAYLYYAEYSSVLCIDRYTAEQTFLPVKDSFVEQLKGRKDANYLLLLDGSGTQLVLAYYLRETATFDAEEYREYVWTVSTAHLLHGGTQAPRRFEPITPSAGYVRTGNLDSPLYRITDHLYIDGVKVRIRYTDFDRVEEVLDVLASGYRETLAIDKYHAPQADFEAICAIADQLCELLVLDGVYASIPDTVDLDGGLSSQEYAATRKMREQITQFSAYVPTKGNEWSYYKESLALTLSRYLLQPLNGYTYPWRAYAESTRPEGSYFQKEEYYYTQVLYAALNEGYRESEMKILSAELARILESYLPEPHIIGEDKEYHVNYAMIRDSVERALPALVEALTGERYTAFLMRWGFCPVRYDGMEIRMEYNPYGVQDVLSQPRTIDTEALRALLADMPLTFEQGGVTMRKQARIGYYGWLCSASRDPEARNAKDDVRPEYAPLALLTLGIGEDGAYYLESCGYSARLTIAQYRALINLYQQGSAANFAESELRALETEARLEARRLLAEELHADDAPPAEDDLPVDDDPPVDVEPPADDDPPADVEPDQTPQENDARIPTGLLIAAALAAAVLAAALAVLIATRKKE